MKDFFTASDGAEIPYYSMGNAEPLSPALIFIHGLTDSAASFRGAMRVASREYRCISFDLRGHGRSKSGQGCNVGRAAADLRELKEKLCPGGVILVGYSLGAFIILEYIDNYGPDGIEKIVLTDISPKFISEGEWKFGLYRGEYTRADFDGHMRGIESEFYPGVAYFVYRNVRKGGQGRRFRDSAPLWAHVIARVRIRNKPEKRAAVFFYFKSLCERDHRDTLARLNVDTAIFYADPGSLFLPETAEYMAGRVPGGAALVPFTDSSHIQLLHPAERFARRLLRFIRNGI